MTVTQQPDPAARPAVFVLFGATGDLAKRMVLPALYRLACEGLLPRRWLLVGNGRGGITHQNFRAHVHDALTEFGPKPEGTDWDSFARRVFFAGGGFSPGSPGSLPDVLGEARTSLGGSPLLVHYLAVPPVAFGGLTQALGQGADPLPPYVRLIHDVLLGDRSLFTRRDGLAAVWQVAEPLLTNPPPACGYAPGSRGSAEARELIAPGQWLLGQ